jgi:hypothetical protein
MLAELAAQLRGEAGHRQVKGAEIILAENGGGVIGMEEAVASVRYRSGTKGYCSQFENMLGIQMCKSSPRGRCANSGYVTR